MRYKRRAKLQQVVIIQDDREKQPWSFLPRHYPVEVHRLTVGDYSFKGYENKIAIEKKSGLRELLSNLIVGNRARFERCLERLSKYPVKILVVCEPLDGRLLRYYLAVLKKKSNCQLIEDTLYYWLARTSIKLGIPVVFCQKEDVEKTVLKIIEQCREKLGEI
jgi:ERCC4-type nuclease